MLKNINKISIIGGSGTGKTTLSESLSKDVNIPVYHIDGIHHLKNWKVRDSNERDKIILDLIKKKKVDNRRYISFDFTSKTRKI